MPPRLRMEPTGSRHTLLDGAWWPRSTDLVAALPGLVLAIDRLRDRSPVWSSVPTAGTSVPVAWTWLGGSCGWATSPANPCSC